MRIIEVSVTRLFGIFDHTVRLNREDRITIIHGPNGFGKTILLQLLEGLVNAEYIALLEVPFERLTVLLDDGELWVKNTVATQGSLFSEVGTQMKTTTIHYRPSEEGDHRFPLSEVFAEPQKVFSDPRKSFSKSIRKWVDGSNNERLGVKVSDFPIPDWLENLQTSIRIHFTQIDRLISKSERNRPTIVEHAKELASLVSKRLAESAELSQKMDQSFPVRLVKNGIPNGIAKEPLEEKLRQLTAKRKELVSVGLLPEEEDLPMLKTDDIGESNLAVLEIYVEDMEAKLSIFNGFAEKLALLKRIINRRFLYKQMTISRERGLSFANANGDDLPLDKLSSGEQQELVLFYEMLFKVKPDTLMLIDEPELSLHVAWQKDFLEDLQDVTRLAEIDILIATHSPQIINDRWDLTVELKGPAVK